MLTRYLDRRRFIRVPASGPARWLSGSRQGHCELLDISPGGAGIRMPARNALQLGQRITLDVELSPGKMWNVATGARVVRQAPDDEGLCRVGLEFIAAAGEAGAARGGGGL